ncbi:MAG: hypothetical protein JSU94_12660 [Phycisphaerales bacterium]|nr:MAG: hypothetical protein JSU94_12660 [Phycisphaerales bacterium]
MRAIRSYKLVWGILLIAAAFAAGLSVSPSPPDNAAVLYYQAGSLYNGDSKIERTVADFAEGKTKSSKTIEDALEKNRRAIWLVLDASEVENCDWGLDYSQGSEMRAPSYHPLRQLAILIVADARILAQKGDYRTALTRCISLYRTARHVNDRILISHLVAVALEALANDCVIGIVSEMPEDEELLRWLKAELAKIDAVPLSLGQVLRGERQANLISMSPERLTKALDTSTDKRFKDVIAKSIRDKNEEFFRKNRQYWKNYIGRVTDAFDLPYAKAHSQLNRLAEELPKDPEENPDAVLTALLFGPPMKRICTLSVRSKTHYNAVKAGVEVYIVRARTGRLPDALPSGLPGDLFSGKAFKYEKAGKGFILHCQGKDLDNDTTYSYGFGTSAIFNKVIQQILNARTATLDIITQGPRIHETVVGKRIRRTFSNTAAFMVIDPENARILALNPASKTATYIDIEGPSAEAPKSCFGLVRDILTKFKNNSDRPVQELGQGLIDSVKVVGFRVEGQDVQLTIWADPETTLPMHIEVVRGKSGLVLENFVFDAPVESSQVSMDVPAGFTLKAMDTTD